jgi:hypothetical protein
MAGFMNWLQHNPIFLVLNALSLGAFALALLLPRVYLEPLGKLSTEALLRSFQPETPDSLLGEIQTFPEEEKRLCALALKYRTFLIITYAMSETITLCGFAMGFLSGYPTIIFPYLIVGLTLMLLKMPSEGKYIQALESLARNRS